jgi:hypothetical protein
MATVLYVMVCSLVDRYKSFGGTAVFVSCITWCYIPQDYDHKMVKVKLSQCMPRSHTGGASQHLGTR